MVDNSDNGTSDTFPGGNGGNKRPLLTQEEQLRALMEKVTALKAQVDAGSQSGQRGVKPPNLAKAVRRPEPFKGTKNDKDNRTIETWFKSIERFIAAHHFTLEKDKIETAASFLEGTAQREYEIRVKEYDEFTTFRQFKDWLTSHYSPADPVNTFRDRLFHCKQQIDESFDDYFNRFRVANSLIDEPLPTTYLVYLFIDNLQGRFKRQIRGDKEFSDYKNITLDDVLGKLKRTNFDNLPDDSV